MVLRKTKSLHPTEGFEFPKCPVKAICDLFVFGMETQNIHPFRLFDTSGFDSKIIKIDKTRFCKANFVFTCILSVAVANEKLRSEEELAIITLSHRMGSSIRRCIYSSFGADFLYGIINQETGGDGSCVIV